VTAANANPTGECHIVGCHKELCMSDPSITSDCNLQRPDFHCYEQFGQCGHHDAGGACNWKLTGELIDCVNKANAGGNPSSSPAPGTPTTTSAPGVTTTSQPQAPPGQVTTAPSGPNPAPTTTNAPSSSQCYKDNVQVASNKCGHNLLALDFKTMNYDAFRAYVQLVLNQYYLLKLVLVLNMINFKQQCKLNVMYVCPDEMKQIVDEQHSALGEVILIVVSYLLVLLLLLLLEVILLVV
jgi:hypothetical protein